VDAIGCSSLINRSTLRLISSRIGRTWLIADEAIAIALDARLSERKSRPVPNVVRPVEGPTDPQLITVELERSRKRLLIRRNSWSG
jgi:hypothetical protein